VDLKKLVSQEIYMF